MKPEQWRQIILTLTMDAEAANPFEDVRIWATFSGPDGKTIRREAYWDGGQIYRIAFAATEPGLWSYEIQSESPLGLLHLLDEQGEIILSAECLKGELECTSYSGNLPIYQHGFLKVSDDQRSLTYADGTPFFWLGDTHWEFAYGERWDESNHPQMNSMFRGMVDRRVEQGYTVYQTNLRSDEGTIDGGSSGVDRYWKEHGEHLLPNVAFYQKELDRRMYYLADKGIVNALGLAWFADVDKDLRRVKALARYIIARYGALPMVWTLGGEVAGYFPMAYQHFIDLWREVAKVQEELDGYGTLQTAHYTNTRPFADYYQDEDWHDFTLNQAGHGDWPINAYWYQRFHQEHPRKPFIEGEVLYEFVSTLEENGTRLCTPDMVRRAAYISMQTGGCGFTYGAQGIWDNVWEKGHANPFGGGFNQFDIPWHEAIDGEGGKQMGYMKDFYLQQRFWEMIPHQEEEISTANPFDAKAPLAICNTTKTRWILYYTANIPAWRRATLHGAENGSYSGTWFNPRTGEYLPMEGTVHVTDGSFQAPSRLNSSDWLLVMEQ